MLRTIFVISWLTMWVSVAGVLISFVAALVHVYFTQDKIATATLEMCLEWKRTMNFRCGAIAIFLVLTIFSAMASSVCLHIRLEQLIAIEAAKTAE